MSKGTKKLLHIIFVNFLFITIVFGGVVKRETRTNEEVKLDSKKDGPSDPIKPEDDIEIILPFNKTLSDNDKYVPIGGSDDGEIDDVEMLDDDEQPRPQRHPDEDHVENKNEHVEKIEATTLSGDVEDENVTDHQTTTTEFHFDINK